MPIASSIGGGRGGALSLNLAGATAATRYAGGTTTGAPTTGTFAAGDHVVAQDGRLWICLVAGTPGTWRASDGLVFAQSLTADTATMDTGAVIPAGYNLLEVWLYARTDEAVTQSTVAVRFNGDAGNNYDKVRIQDANATVSGANNLAAASPAILLAGASCTAAVFSTYRFTIPVYAGTVGNKAGEYAGGVPDQTAANTLYQSGSFEWRSTAAINQLTAAITSGTGQKFKAGSAMYVYVR